MFNVVDSQEQIVLAQMAFILRKYAYKITSENGDGESLLRCAGLSKFVQNYADCLNPHSFNGSWKNPNPTYNPGLAISEICMEIESNKKILGIFLNEILKRVQKIDESDIDNITNYLEVLGYSLQSKQIENHYDETYQYSLSPYTKGGVQRQEDISYMVKILNTKHSDLIYCYEEAISTYGHSEYKSCIDNCRTLFENFF